MALPSIDQALMREKGMARGVEGGGWEWPIDGKNALVTFSIYFLMVFYFNRTRFFSSILFDPRPAEYVPPVGWLSSGTPL